MFAPPVLLVVVSGGGDYGTPHDDEARGADFGDKAAELVESLLEPRDAGQLRGNHARVAVLDPEELEAADRE